MVQEMKPYFVDFPNVKNNCLRFEVSPSVEESAGMTDADWAKLGNDFIFYHLLRDIGQAFDLTDDFFTREFKVKLVNINLAAPFFIHMSTAFWMSVVTATPYLFFEIWRFIRPALYPNERKGVRKALTIGTVMFFIGVLLGYFMVYPLTLRFLSTYQLSAEIENQISLNSYIDNFMMLVL